jgi:non-ribosomal peptide synthetase component F
VVVFDHASLDAQMKAQGDAFARARRRSPAAVAGGCAAAGGRAAFNLYGPTETTVWSSVQW